jgi:hypothetical protein
MPRKSLDLMWIARIGIVALVVVLRLLLREDWMGNLLLVLGWILGYALVEADHLFYVAVCNPQELTCQRIRHEMAQKNWRNAWGLLQETADQRNRLPVHNILTAFILTVMGIWLVTSGGNLLAVGIVTGLAIRLFSEFVADPNYPRWYWLFSRDFNPGENKLMKYLWGSLLLLELLFLVRR